MRARTKFVATIIAMCLVITLGIFGILAVKTLNMSVGGNISFSAEGLSLEVSDGTFKTTANAAYSGISTQSNILQGFVMNTDTKLSDVQSKINSWTGLELTLDSQGDAVLHFTVKNNMTTPLYVYVGTTLGTNTNNNMNIAISSNGTEIAAGATTPFEITFDVLDTNINAGLAGFEVSIDFTRENLMKTQNKIDAGTGIETSEVDYYYVEMGTYNGQPVRWRYVADSNGTKYDGTSSITKLSGYFVLETEIITLKRFLEYNKHAQNSADSEYYHTTEGYTNIYAHDYGLSDIRAYLTNTGTGGYMEALGITQDNAIYSMIKGRKVTDLYSNIVGDAGTAIDSTNANYSLSTTGEQEDKLWLLSQKEANTFLGSDKASRVWGTGQTYWLRSPYYLSAYGYIVTTNGDYSSFPLYSIDYVRPAFKI